MDNKTKKAISIENPEEYLQRCPFCGNEAHISIKASGSALILHAACGWCHARTRDVGVQGECSSWYTIDKFLEAVKEVVLSWNQRTNEGGEDIG